LFCYFSYLFFVLFFELFDSLHDLHSFPTRRSSDLASQILRIIEQDRLSEHAASTGAYLHERLQSIADSFEKVRNVRGRGLLNAFDLPDTAMRNRFIANGLKHGALFLGCGERTIRFRPSLIMEKKHIDAGMEIVERVLREL